MRELLVISGKGGTGKTSITAALAHLMGNAVICDLDVDAPDLHILLDPSVEQSRRFISGNEAIVEPALCTRCGLCAEVCAFDAVVPGEKAFAVDPLRCEGCMVCVALCPARAIAFPEKHCGDWYVSRTAFGPMVHAQLFPGEENSGRLVTLLKKEAREIARHNGLERILCDGAPGIGCPVISSLSGVDQVLVVTEPTPSGLHDLKRVLDLCLHFRVKPLVVINKWDINPDQSAAVEDFCRESGHPLVGRVPHHPVVVQAMIRGLSVTLMPDNPVSEAVRDIFHKIDAIAGADPA